MTSSPPPAPPAVGRADRGRALLALALAVPCAAAILTAADRAYVDDTYSSLKGPTVVPLKGSPGFFPIRLRRDLPDNSALDARTAMLMVANSRVVRPTPARPCQMGDLPLNPYPLTIEDRSGVALVGGTFNGQVPQDSDWRSSYCNSAAILFEHAANGTVDGVRISRVWDAIRMGRGSPGLLVTNTWISQARDDALEDDYLLPLTVRDTLIDGTFQGISVKRARGNADASGNDHTVRLSGVLIRLATYPYKGFPRFGALEKSEQESPAVEMTNSIVAIDGGSKNSFPKQWHWTWAKLATSSNNLLLWLGDDAVPAAIEATPAPRGLRVMTGRAARQEWTRARNNWINCHPRVARLSTDPRSEPGACVAGTWGGFTD